MIEEAEFLPAKEAAAYLGVSRATLDNYAREGRISRYKQGAPRRTMYRVKDLRSLKEITQVKRPKKK